ncbi:hypothetical protein [Streptomyces sp. NPDC059003]|uniref:hypothetical protein n=1 Tax=Streptomyces sp. NPDC059003 TaxID=3346691 RepID=UPI0036CDE6D3
MEATEEEAMPHSQRMIAICRTAACAANGIPYPGTYYAAPEPPIYRGVCMGCGQPITDLVPVRE